MLCTLPDGYVTDNTDCDDNNAVVRPESSGFCNGYDDNCDGIIDEEGALGTPLLSDTDGMVLVIRMVMVLYTTRRIRSDQHVCDDNDNDISF